MKWPWSSAAPTPEMLDDTGIRHALEHRLLEYACLYRDRQGLGLTFSCRTCVTDLNNERSYTPQKAYGYAKLENTVS